ncbi:MAG: hypothetical protein H0W20_01745 [Chthoniobacterales bacterium]|nr:hypothetical protein [Chthoniobacterales bacterium]
MDHTLFRYDEPYAPRQRRANWFAWTIAILLLIGLTLAVWLGSYYIFGQPERPDSYRILQKLKKIDQPKRFQLTAAPAGEFLNPKQLHDRCSALRPAELAKLNAELARNYIRNFQQVRGQVPYVVGRFTIMEARELTPNDLFKSGMVALTSAVDYGELLLEHIYPADAQAVPLMKGTLATGLEIKLERAHDLSAVIHAERLPDGRVMITTVPLLYGSYTVTQGRGSFSLEPPFDLNMAAGWPLFKDPMRKAAEARYASYREKLAPPTQGLAIPGLVPPSDKPAVATNELIRVEPAMPVDAPPATAVTPAPAVAAAASATPKGGKVAKTSPAPAASPAPRAVAAKPGTSPAPAAAVAAGKAGAAVSTASGAPAVAVSPGAAVALASPAATPPGAAAPSAAPVLPPGTDQTLASTAGGGTWKTYPAGKMPQGRLIATGDLRDVAERGMTGERVYLRGQFVVNFTESNRAVLRPRSNMAESMLRLGAPSSTRIIVEFPSGMAPPTQGAVVSRDEARPYEITEVRKQADGQLNVFVREIMQ